MGVIRLKVDHCHHDIVRASLEQLFAERVLPPVAVQPLVLLGFLSVRVAYLRQPSFLGAISSVLLRRTSSRSSASPVLRNLPFGDDAVAPSVVALRRRFHPAPVAPAAVQVVSHVSLSPYRSGSLPDDVVSELELADHLWLNFSSLLAAQAYGPHFGPYCPCFCHFSCPYHPSGHAGPLVSGEEAAAAGRRVGGGRRGPARSSYRLLLLNRT